MAERADAVRNRERVLVAADALFDGTGNWQAVTVDAVAARAGVGKGTVFRAWGDRVGLLRGVVARRSAALVDEVARGAPPLGPGTPPRRHLTAVLDALLEFKLRNRSLSAALDDAGSGSPYTAEWYGWWHALLVEDLVRLPKVPDPDFTAHALLAAVRSDLVEHLVGDQGWSEERLRAHLSAHVARVVR